MYSFYINYKVFKKNNEDGLDKVILNIFIVV